MISVSCYFVTDERTSLSHKQTKIHFFKCYLEILPRDCSDLPQGSQSGVYTIHPTNETFDVYCDMDIAGFGWTVSIVETKNFIKLSI